MNKETLIKQFGEAIKEMRQTHIYRTYYWNLDVDDNNNQWAIILGWADGFDEQPEDDCTDGTWRICAKLAYQPTNSTMQCDYDTDWLMPYDKKSGEVDDNEISIYPESNVREIIDWFLKCYKDYESQAKYDIVLCEKPFSEGLTITDVTQLMEKLSAEEMLPLEIESKTESSAMGFISFTAADSLNFNYEYSGLNEFIQNILNDMNNESETCEYEFKGLKIWMSR